MDFKSQVGKLVAFSTSFRAVLDPTKRGYRK